MNTVIATIEQQNTTENESKVFHNIKLTFLDIECKEHDINISFEKNGLTNHFTNFAMMEEIQVAVRLAVESIIKHRLIAVNGQFETIKDGAIKPFGNWASPRIYNKELYKAMSAEPH